MKGFLVKRSGFKLVKNEEEITDKIIYLLENSILIF